VQLCKNLALSGVSLVLHDPATVSSADLAANFFLTVEDVGTPVSGLASRATRGAGRPHPTSRTVALRSPLAKRSVQRRASSVFAS